MKISKKDIEHLANLAKLSLTKDEIEKFSVQIESILDYVGRLKNIDTSSVQPEAVLAPEEIFRKDNPEDSDKAEDLINQVPKTEGGAAKTPSAL